MPRIFKDIGKSLIVFFLLFIAFFAMFYSMRKPQTTSPNSLETTLEAESKPAQLTLSTLTSDALYYIKDFFTFRKKEEKMRLENMVKEYEQQVRDYDEIVAENERLKKILSYRENISFKESFARVVYRDPSNWVRSLVVDQGGEEGLIKGLAVFSPEGVVGKLVEIYPKSARVLLITDPGCTISAYLKRSRVVGTVSGRGDGLLVMNYLSGEDDVQVGDVVLTGGEGHVFPRGLLIGYVDQVSKKQEGMSLGVVIKPSVEFNKLEEVLISHQVND